MRFKQKLLLMPLVCFLTVFFLIPLGIVGFLSFTDPTFGLSNYKLLFEDGYFLGVLGSTLFMSFSVTALCLIIGYPAAYLIATINNKYSKFLFISVLLSLWLSFLVRTYAWMIMLSNNGPIANILMKLGYHGDLNILFTRFSATLGIVHALLPLMVITLYAVMRRIDLGLILAAKNLGASSFTAFRTVFLPLSSPAIVNGCTIVFVTCLGFYVMPVLLGSPRDQVIAGLIGQQIEELLNFGEAAAMSIVLLLVTTFIYSIYNYFYGIEKLWGDR